MSKDPVEAFCEEFLSPYCKLGQQNLKKIFVLWGLEIVSKAFHCS